MKEGFLKQKMYSTGSLSGWRGAARQRTWWRGGIKELILYDHNHRVFSPQTTIHEQMWVSRRLQTLPSSIAEVPIQWNGYQITQVVKSKLKYFSPLMFPSQALGQASLEFEFVTHKGIADVTLSIRDTEEESLRPAPVRSWDCDEFLPGSVSQ